MFLVNLGARTYGFTTKIMAQGLILRLSDRELSTSAIRGNTGTSNINGTVIAGFTASGLYGSPQLNKPTL